MTRREMFNNLFGEEDRYFGEWYVYADDSLTEFFENLVDGKNFFTHIQHLYLYFETLEILKKEEKGNSQEFSIGRIMCRDTRYCCILLLLIGLIDQNTKNEKEISCEGQKKLMSLKKRFKLVMNKLPDAMKNEMATFYNGHKQHKSFSKVVEQLYSTRNFFAHDVLPQDAVPQDSYLVADEKRPILMYLNLPHGKIFLSIVVALVLHLGFKGEIKIASNKKFKSIVDMLRTS